MCGRHTVSARVRVSFVYVFVNPKWIIFTPVVPPYAKRSALASTQRRLAGLMSQFIDMDLLNAVL